VASFHEGCLATYKRMVRASIGDFRVSLHGLGLEKIHRHYGFGLDSICISSALLDCGKNRTEARNLRLRPRPPRGAPGWSSVIGIWTKPLARRRYRVFGGRLFPWKQDFFCVEW
jgi:hypothetical protein